MRPTNVGELKRSDWVAGGRAERSVRDEIRANLLAALEAGSPLFPGIRGFEDSIIPQVVNALLARQDFILLGLRGQAKSRILRALTGFLDEWMPIIAGSEVNDHPLAPISKFGRDRLAELADATPIAWVHRNDRYVEKLATPDVTIADLIGDLDPIKAARGGHLLSDELTMHYGLLPRANRGIFAINELPDLSGKIQVGLFNVMQEGDVQIKGYPVRLPLDVVLVFTANPEDYTARGKIVTPLKDRIGAEIQTHYPKSVGLGMEITAQEAWVERPGAGVAVPEFVREVIERIAFEARSDRRIDRRSGVSQRLPISLLENVVSNAERRGASLGEPAPIVTRISDLYAALPAITGKLELEYEGELQGGETIAKELIRRAANRTFLERAADFDPEPIEAIVTWFDGGQALKLAPEERSDLAIKAFRTVPGLATVAAAIAEGPESDAGTLVAASELVLEALAAQKRISRTEDFGWTAHRPTRPERRREIDD
ncbi:MAG: magnesium chelatase [Gemmatimonadetes bacterium]|nr:magnesium chelatase [Gemmatimonadota bacterium]